MKLAHEDKPTNCTFLWLTLINDVCEVLQVGRCALFANTVTSRGMLRELRTKVLCTSQLVISKEEKRGQKQRLVL